MNKINSVSLKIKKIFFGIDAKIVIVAFVFFLIIIFFTDNLFSKLITIIFGTILTVALGNWGRINNEENRDELLIKKTITNICFQYDMVSYIQENFLTPEYAENKKRNMQWFEIKPINFYISKDLFVLPEDILFAIKLKDNQCLRDIRIINTQFSILISSIKSWIDLSTKAMDLLCSKKVQFKKEDGHPLIAQALQLKKLDESLFVQISLLVQHIEHTLAAFENVYNDKMTGIIIEIQKIYPSVEIYEWCHLKQYNLANHLAQPR